jgi:hypothetical protein
MSRQLLRAGLLAVGVGAVGCFELSGPQAGLSAITPILAPWPAVVKDDVLRDSTGVIAPLRVAAYDADGDSVTDATVTFIALDRGLHIDANGVVHGDSIRTTAARIVAQVSRGGDVMQTPELTIGVVPRPDSVAPSQDTTFTSTSVPIGNPAPITSDPLTVKVFSRVPGAAATPIQFWIIRYEIIKEPAGVSGAHTAVFSGAGDARVAFDTTDASGVASRTIVLQRAVLTPATGRQDVEVQVTVRDAGTGGGAAGFKFILPYVQ